MPMNSEMDYDVRKLDALMCISAAIASLGESLSVVVRQSLDQTNALKRLDTKLDSLIEMVAPK